MFLHCVCALACALVIGAQQYRLAEIDALLYRIEARGTAYCPTLGNTALGTGSAQIVLLSRNGRDFQYRPLAYSNADKLNVDEVQRDSERRVKFAVASFVVNEVGTDQAFWLSDQDRTCCHIRSTYTFTLGTQVHYLDAANTAQTFVECGGPSAPKLSCSETMSRIDCAEPFRTVRLIDVPDQDRPTITTYGLSVRASAICPLPRIGFYHTPYYPTIIRPTPGGVQIAVIAKPASIYPAIASFWHFGFASRVALLRNVVLWHDQIEDSLLQLQITLRDFGYAQQSWDPVDRVCCRVESSATTINLGLFRPFSEVIDPISVMSIECNPTAAFRPSKACTSEYAHPGRFACDEIKRTFILEPLAHISPSARAVS
ncbi:uncharacterized protein L969DRAFT_553690 [Mixia osmundae IAM 14324]|uniref:Secreted protein n=1 Tax=Mixia osmundae (strain CBS 9802 / IAM 14324 / JCM 22182 / KY 12970) TaxID=764103 RepID=G7E0M8_MIXOS|nr:uncharacterized protein L969DRAFT_553690 [Mixia osmundae IAM 14324]KEI37864.1 hypothetical protein L969DRAFT_553690 [Mixia osmundae IAM 14324]GAA96388.1 hypothetical protein E5Q_03055 [Mixia osmundae IAM 14324]